MRNRGQKCAAQPVRLGLQTGGMQIAGEVHALDRQGRLVGQGIEQTLLILCQQRPWLVANDPGDAEGSAAGTDRLEQPFCTRQGIGAAAGHAIVPPAPFRGGEVGVL